ncbi:aminodeoxychorismate lyase [Cognaticolwellia beringensis]|uniref:Aminodeoxychorismate lyase n=1 Tax=Cognaticolwellia beringensis TaxID=1967665 RepID=A0A222GDZ7_9GAMM|nr:aminodeoxychorismate lyase [Cognaticolwellia beringensis]ASP49594.1 aminodeoxychorismate lyase [Cognaticolwellia beringensis]
MAMITSMALSFVDGQLADSISIDDRGLAYGDGCFTTALIINGEVAMLDQHLNRLVKQSQQLGLPAFNLPALEATIKNISGTINIGIVKVIITCGSGGRGYSRLGAEQAKAIVSVHDYPTHYPQWQKHGISVGISEQKLGINPMLAGLKHLNRLEQVMLRAELDKRPEDDLLVSDVNGNVIECCSANVFWLDEGQWHTPLLTTAGVAGLMRDKILLNNPRIEPANYQLSQLGNIDAMFISNAILGIVPVKIFNDKKLDVSLVKSMQNQLLKPKS